MRRKARAAGTINTGIVGQHKRYADLPPPPKKKKSLRRRLGWLKTVAGLALAAWFATIAVGPGDRAAIMKMINETLDRQPAAQSAPAPQSEPATLLTSN
jgi:hypothetical protein